MGDRKRHSWIRWEMLTRIGRPGVVKLDARASNLAGRTQPERPEWKSARVRLQHDSSVDYPGAIGGARWSDYKEPKIRARHFEPFTLRARSQHQLGLDGSLLPYV